MSHDNFKAILPILVMALHRLNSMSERELIEANLNRGFCKHLLTWSVAISYLMRVSQALNPGRSHFSVNAHES